MKILFVSIQFYEYTDKIISELKKNYEVDFLILEPKLSLLEKLSNSLSKGYYLRKKSFDMQKRFFRKKISTEYDIIFVLVGRGLNISAFEEFIKSQIQAKKILYLWDDINRVEEFNSIRTSFDYVYSFDKIDCENNNLIFLPLFYTDLYSYNNEEKKYDISCVGGWHSDRANIIEKIKEKVSPKRKSYFFLSTTKNHLLKEKFLRRSVPEYIKGKKLPMEEVSRIIKESKITVDIPYEGQNGLSIRTIEALASHTKLVTTNINVQDYDFYNSNNICIINRENPIIDEIFLETEYEKISETIVEKYSISSWLQRLLNV